MIRPKPGQGAEQGKSERRPTPTQKGREEKKPGGAEEDASPQGERSVARGEKRKAARPQRGADRGGEQEHARESE